MTTDDLLQALDDINAANADCDRSLEEYLRALLPLVEARGAQPPTYEWLADALRLAFAAEPAPFDPAWLEREQLPRDGKEDAGPELARDMLLWQIADLRRMRGGALEDKWRCFGVESPTGNDWYNFDPRTYMGCTAAGLNDHPDGGRLAAYRDRCTWYVLAWFLELGRLYE